MTNWFYCIYGISYLVSGIYLLVTVFGWYKPKHKTEEKAKSYEQFYEKYNTFIKIGSIFLILRGIFVLIN